MTRRVLIFLLACLPVAGTAAGLQLTPSLCAVSEDDNICHVSVKVDFSADDNARYCLSIKGKGLIRCFWGETDKDIQVYIDSDEDIQFMVTKSESGERVASATLKIAQYQPKRHRRRYGWGLL
ncbi:DUF3019 domain-containing protein [Microbulbifer aggregans]|uniref:DUF3019 domain-containing protein n=1 Tax=Microbulbifer aggregans TaxID=1769779 RepID=UPI001CFC91A6|nr:DUF3019 domain-containing protein [Microbulbifer aggregans]